LNSWASGEQYKLVGDVELRFVHDFERRRNDVKVETDDGLLPVLVVLALTPSSFAQVQITITPNVSAGEIQTNRAAQTATTGSSGAGVLVTGQLMPVRL